MKNQGDSYYRLKEAALHHFQAQRSKARANLQVYLDQPAGVGEHPNIVDVVVSLVKEIAEADECIKIIKEVG